MSSLNRSNRVSEVRNCFLILPRPDQKKVIFITFIQTILGILDIVGIGLIGILSALGLSGVSAHGIGGKVRYILNLLGLTNFSLNYQVAIIGLIAAILLLAKTVISIILNRKILHFLSLKGAQLSSKLMRQVLSQTLLQVRNLSTQDTLYSLTYGVEAIMLRVISPLTAIISDAALLVFISIGLFVLDPKIALANLAIFGVLGVILQRLLRSRAKSLGSTYADFEVKSNEKILEVLLSFKESTIRGTKSYYADQFEKLRIGMAGINAELAFLPNISKYVIETAIVIGGISIAAIQFSTEDAIHAITGLSIFMASGSRVAPAILRIQQNSLNLKSGVGIAERTLSLISVLPDDELDLDVNQPLKFDHSGFLPSIEVESLSFTYPGSSNPAISDVSLRVSPGELIAIVGPSGSGKTTFADLILGLLLPDSGNVLISNVPPKDCVARWPGAIAYVPQDINIMNGTLQENIVFGYPENLENQKAIARAVQAASLIEFIEESELGLQTLAGEYGVKMSGGQRQRLGIARAIFSSPKLILLDEATSSLDSVTENTISNALQELRGKTTLIIIAHRLSTIINADQVVYMEEGKIIANGSFTEVKKQVPNFAEQARLMGI